ncbi:NlpC/P60 family protein [Amycolatopsis sp. NPDC057786]|uniref:NlpC/P60 family protein n=1 Tax=Amycolatopsis sp. NPDC057786 TaxID=3346250 RepID=UPI00366F7D4A
MTPQAPTKKGPTPVPWSQSDRPLLPGDLVFYGAPNNIHHVGPYIGGRMINTPTFGQPVQIDNYRHKGAD